MYNFANTVLEFLFSFLAQALVDEGIRNNNLHFIYVILVAQLLFASQTLGEVIRSYLLLYVGIGSASHYCLASCRSSCNYPFLEKKNLGDLFQRITNNQRIEQFLTAQSFTVLFSIVVFGVILSYYSLTIFWMFLAGALLYVVWIVLLAKRRAVLEYKRFEASAEHQSQLQDLLYGMPEIRLNGSQHRRHSC